MKTLRLTCPYTRNNNFSWNQEAYFLSLNFFLSATTSPNDPDVAAVASRIEELVASVKRRPQYLHKDNDGCKGRAQIRRKIREEKRNLNSVVVKYNTLVPNAEKLTLDTILSDEIVWPWQLTHSGMYTIPLTMWNSYIVAQNLSCFNCSPKKTLNTILKYNWLMFHLCIPDSVDLRTKRKAFDTVMAVRRLEEERILIAEMNKHWKSLCTRADTLKQMSSQLSNVTSGTVCICVLLGITLQYFWKFLINEGSMCFNV